MMMLRDTDIVFSASPMAAEAADLSPAAVILALVWDVRAFIRKYVVLSSEQALALALWTVHTHVIAAADTTPYVHVTSATKRAGKTRLLEVLEVLVRRPWMTGRTSAAALVRKIDVDQPTLLLDESDAAFGGDKDYAEALRAILNIGHKGNGVVSLCVGKGADLSVRDFHAFSAKCIAGIGKLPDTVADRAIPIVLKRRMMTESVARWRDRDARAEAAPLHQRLTKWSGTAIEPLRAARPALPSQLSDRAADVWEPLLAIADLMAPPWSEKARAAAIALMGAEQDTDPTIELLTDLRDTIMDKKAPITITTKGTVATKELLEKLTGREDRPWATWRRDKPITPHGLARLLGPLGIHPHQHERTSRGYRVEAFTDAFARYLPSEVSQCCKPNENGGETCITLVSGQPAPNQSDAQFEADSIGVASLRHLEPGDDDDAGRF